MLWTLGAAALILIAAGVGLQVAIARNGPAVLSTIDQISGGPRGAVIAATISTGDHAAQKLIVWTPEDADTASSPLPVLLFTHGGSWKNGDPDDYGFIGRAFVPEGFIVVLAGYRLHPDAVYPAMLEDTAAAIGWTRREIAAFGGDPNRITIAGHSAGAYNVVMAAMEERWLAAHDMTSADIAGVIGLSGPYDFVPLDSESTIASFGHVDEPQQTQPLTHLAEETPMRLPPMLLIHGEKDTLVKPRNSRLLADELAHAEARAVAHFYPQMEHNDPLISLAAPWRSRRDVASRIAGFARSASAAGSEPDTAE